MTETPGESRFLRYLRWEVVGGGRVTKSGGNTWRNLKNLLFFLFYFYLIFVERFLGVSESDVCWFVKKKSFIVYI